MTGDKRVRSVAGGNARATAGGDDGFIERPLQPDSRRSRRAYRGGKSRLASRSSGKPVRLQN